nr:MAG TPA: hypothetical protein [Herelleviridae sp.]
MYLLGDNGIVYPVINITKVTVKEVQQITMTKSIFTLNKTNAPFI